MSHSVIASVSLMHCSELGSGAFVNSGMRMFYLSPSFSFLISTPLMQLSLSTLRRRNFLPIMWWLLLQFSELLSMRVFGGFCFQLGHLQLHLFGYFFSWDQEVLWFSFELEKSLTLWLFLALFPFRFNSSFLHRHKFHRSFGDFWFVVLLWGNRLSRDCRQVVIF